MKKLLTSFLLIVLSVLNKAAAQDFSTASSYMNYISLQHLEVAKGALDYASTIAHDKSMTKVETKRQALILAIKKAADKVNKMPSYQENSILRDSTLSFLKTVFWVINQEFGQVQTLERIAERSYEDMEAYMLAQEVASKHLDEANERLRQVTENFASNYHVNLIDGNNNEISRKMKIINSVNEYHRRVYLTFFKCSKEEFYLVKSISDKRLKDVKQCSVHLQEDVNEGLSTLDTMKAYFNDKTLQHAAYKALEFYRNEYKDNVPKLIDFLALDSLFETQKAVLDNGEEKKHSKAEIDSFNATVKEYNAQIYTFNNIIKKLNGDRARVVNDWAKASEHFLERYVP